MICPARTPTLPEFFEDTYLPERLVCASPDTIEHYRLSVKHFARVKPGLSIGLIDGKAIAAFRNAMAVGRSSATVNSYTRPIMAMLRMAAEEEYSLLGRVPKIKKIKENLRSPLALTMGEFQKVLARVKTLEDTIGGYPAPDWWEAVLLTFWESGLRFKALLAVRTVDLVWENSGFFSQAENAKDKEGDWHPLQAATLAAIRKIFDPIRELLFPHDIAVETIGKRFRKILDTSGIYAPHGCGMRFHRLRRSKASYTELNGGDAQRALGHSARSVTERYLDPRIVGRCKQPTMPMPM